MAQHQQVPPSHTPGKKGTKPRQTDKLLNAGTRAEVGPFRKPAGACGAPVCVCVSQPRLWNKLPLSWWLKMRCVLSVSTHRARVLGFPGSRAQSLRGLQSSWQPGLGFIWRFDGGKGLLLRPSGHRWASSLGGCSLPCGPFQRGG